MKNTVFTVIAVLLLLATAQFAAGDFTVSNPGHIDMKVAYVYWDETYSRDGIEGAWRVDAWHIVEGGSSELLPVPSSVDKVYIRIQPVGVGKHIKSGSIGKDFTSRAFDSSYTLFLDSPTTPKPLFAQWETGDNVLAGSSLRGLTRFELLTTSVKNFLVRVWYSEHANGGSFTISPLSWVLEDSWRGPRGDQLQHVEAIAFAGNNLVFWASEDRLYKWDFEANRAWWKDFNGRRVLDVAIRRNSPGEVAYALRGNNGEKDWVSVRKTADLSWVAGTRQEGVMSLSADESGYYLAVRGARNYYVYDKLFSVVGWADTPVTGAIAITSGSDGFLCRTFLTRWGGRSITVNQHFEGLSFDRPNVSVAGKAFTSGPLAFKGGWHGGLIAVASDASIYYFVFVPKTPTDYTVKSIANSNGEGHRRGPITGLAVMQGGGRDDGYYVTSTAQDDFVCFWDLDSGALARKLDVGFSSAEIAFSQDNSYMAVANGSISGGERRIKIYRWTGDEPLDLLAPAKATELVQPTALLSNYPNPFNPETWIPYRLSDPAEVTVSIYSVDGRLVRTLELGQMPAGVYSDKERAAYWDGRNAAGEPVASGVYFYTLSAGDFKATRKMVIRK